MAVFELLVFRHFDIPCALFRRTVQQWTWYIAVVGIKSVDDGSNTVTYCSEVSSSGCAIMFPSLMQSNRNLRVYAHSTSIMLPTLQLCTFVRSCLDSPDSGVLLRDDGFARDSA